MRVSFVVLATHPTASPKRTIVIGLLKGSFPREGSRGATRKLTHGNAAALTQPGNPQGAFQSSPSSAVAGEDEWPTLSSATMFHVLSAQQNRPCS